MNTYFTKEEKGSDKTLLFLHGWGCDNTIFAPIIKRLQYNCIAIDLWGFGKSDIVDAEGWTVEQYADKLYEWCQYMQLRNITIVAHSFGARVALILCAKYPQLISQLIITGGAGLRRRSIVRALKVAWFKLKKFLVVCGCANSDILTASGSVDYNKAVGDGMSNTLVKCVSQDLSVYAKEISCPVLLIWGESDKETPLWIAKRLNRLIQNSFVLLINGGHFAFLDNAVLFAGIITAYLQGDQ